MKILVLGGGVIGVTSAWYLAKAGHEVTVVDRQPAPALETSFANAGQISPGYSTPWAAPGIPLKALKWLFQEHAPLALRADGSLFQLEWLARMLRECSASRYAINKERMLRVAGHSRDCLQALRADTGIEYEGRQLGTLQVFRTDAQLAAAQKDVAVLREVGVPHSLLDFRQLVAVEPALAAAHDKIVGALHLPRDETGDCHRFTTELAAMAAGLGVRFEYGASIDGIELGGAEVAAVRIDGKLRTADHYVAALGSYSRAFVARAGLRIPVYPLKGYSITVPIADAARAPRSTVMDETYKIALTRFDDRIRVGGMAEIAGFDLRLDPRREATLKMVLGDLFPGAASTVESSFWTGLRPMTPDGTPIVGPTRLPNLWLNTGHGTLGWTMACGSADILADQISGRRPAIDTEGLSIDRYSAQSARGRGGRGRLHPDLGEVAHGARMVGRHVAR